MRQLHFLLCLTMSTAVLAAFPFGGCLAEELMEAPLGERRLFLDDHNVAKIDHLTRTMHAPTKRGPVLKPDAPSDGSLIQIRSAPMWDENERVYKLIYSAVTYDNFGQIGMALANSKDGIQWEKPDLGQQIEVRGSTRNNRIAVEHKPGVRHPDFSYVAYDPDDPDPNRRYKGLMGDINRTPVVSPDCIHWTRLGSASLASGDESSLTYDRPHRRFLALLKTGNKYGRAHNLFVSNDFVNWKSQFCFGADDEDQSHALKVIRERVADPTRSAPVFVDPDPDLGQPKRQGPQSWRAECYYITVFPYEGLYIGLPTMFYPTGVDANGTNCDGFDSIQLAVTRDLVHWDRLGNREAFIPPGRIVNGRVGVWDRGQMFTTNPVEHGDELWFYYSALKWRDNPYEFNSDRSRRDAKTLSAEEREDQAEGWGAVCLAILRRDGFVSLDAGGDSGTVTTKPFLLRGNKLMANVEAKEQGELRVEVLDRSDQVVAVARPLVGDQLRGEFQWTQGSFAEWKGQTVRLRFTVRDARFYSYWIGE